MNTSESVFDPQRNSESANPTTAGARIISFPYQRFFPKEINSSEENTPTTANRGRGRPASGALRTKHPSEYTSWQNRKHFAKKRGWTWHPDFETFEQFVKIMGPKPEPSYTLDRINPDLPEYSPANCRWLSKQGQSANRRSKRLLKHLGFELSAAEWSRRTKISEATISARIKRGWSDEKALTVPPRWAKDEAVPAESLDKQVISHWAKSFPGGGYIFSPRDFGNLKKIAAAIEANPNLADTWRDVMAAVLADWYGFRRHVERQAGAFNTPHRPTTGFLLDHMYDSVEFVTKRKAMAEYTF